LELKEMSLTGVVKSHIVHWMPKCPNRFKGIRSELPAGLLENFSDNSSYWFFTLLKAATGENPLWRKIGSWIKARQE
jgi:hypothetical protein